MDPDHRYNSFTKKMDILTKANIKLEIKWACQWESDKKNDSELRNFLRTIRPFDKLKPRDALRGSANEVYSMAWVQTNGVGNSKVGMQCQKLSEMTQDSAFLPNYL